MGWKELKAPNCLFFPIFYLIILAFALTLLGSQISQLNIEAHCNCVPWKKHSHVETFRVDWLHHGRHIRLIRAAAPPIVDFQPMPSWTDSPAGVSDTLPAHTCQPQDLPVVHFPSLLPAPTVLPLAVRRAVINFPILTGGKTLASWDLRHVPLAGVLDSGD